MTVRELQRKLEQLVKDHPDSANESIAWTRQVPGLRGGVGGLGLRFGYKPTIALSGNDIPAEDYEEVEVEREWEVTVVDRYTKTVRFRATTAERARDLGHSVDASISGELDRAVSAREC